MSTSNEERPENWGRIIGLITAVIGLIIVIGQIIERCGAIGPQPTPPPTPTFTPAPVEISVYYSDTKQDWFEAVVEKFHAERVTTSAGIPISVTLYPTKSGTSKDAIMAGTITPTAWSPGDGSWVEALIKEWNRRYKQDIVNGECLPTARAPVGFAMWRPMAEALGWPDKPIGWDKIVDLTADPQGWAKYGHPEWGAFKFGHTHPGKSNSGLLILTDLAYAVLGTDTKLSPELIKSDTFTNTMSVVEHNTFHYGISSRDNITRMVQFGPDFLHATNGTETEVLRANSGEYGEPRFPIVFIAPARGMVWPDHPYCVLNAPWSSAEQKEAADIFGDYLRLPEQQELAIENYLRPVSSSIPLHDPFTPENGTDPNISPETYPALPGPAPEVSAAIEDVFLQTKKKATVVLMLDTSKSMAQDNSIGHAAEASASFIYQLDRDDEIYVFVFNDEVAPVPPGGRAGDVKEELTSNIRNLFAQGNTALFDAVYAAVEKAAALKDADLAADRNRLYAVVVLSDGANTSSDHTKDDMLDYVCQDESGEGANTVKVFTIAYAYGEADKEARGLLTDLANCTNGVTYDASPDTLKDVYSAILTQ